MYLTSISFIKWIYSVIRGFFSQSCFFEALAFYCWFENLSSDICISKTTITGRPTANLGLINFLFWSYASWFAEKYQFLRFLLKKFSKAYHLKFIHNVFNNKTQVKLNFGYYTFFVPWIMPLFTFAEGRGIHVLWAHSSIF